MSLRGITWAKAARATLLAAVLVLATLFVAANFVLVDVHLWGLSARLRLGWVAVLPGGAGFGAGLLYARLRRGQGAPGRSAASTVISPPRHTRTVSSSNPPTSPP